MYVKAINLFAVGLIFTLSKKEAAVLTDGQNEDKIDDKILKTAREQAAGKTFTPNPKGNNNAYLVSVSLSEDECKKLAAQEPDFEDHFLELVGQQVDNAVRNDSSRRERPRRARQADTATTD